MYLLHAGKRGNPDYRYRRSWQFSPRDRALSAGEPGSEIQAPMAMVIMCGLASSTALNMVVVPVLYYRFGRPVVLPAS